MKYLVTISMENGHVLILTHTAYIAATNFSLMDCTNP